MAISFDVYSLYDEMYCEVFQGFGDSKSEIGYLYMDERGTWHPNRSLLRFIGIDGNWKQLAQAQKAIKKKFYYRLRK